MQIESFGLHLSLLQRNSAIKSRRAPTVNCITAGERACTSSLDHNAGQIGAAPLEARSRLHPAQLLKVEFTDPDLEGRPYILE